MSFQLSMALRYLGGRKLRTVLTTLAIVFGVLVIFGMNTLIPAFIEAFQVNAMAVAGQVDAAITHRAGEAFSEDVIHQVAEVDGVRVVSGALKRNINLPADYFDGDPAALDRVSAVALVGADPEAIRSLTTYNILEGRFLTGEDRAATVITESLAEVAGVRLGDAMSLPTPTGVVDLTVVGILPQRLLPGNEEILVTLPEAQSLFGMQGEINTVEANFDTIDEARRQQIQSAIESTLGENYAIGVLQPGAEILANIRYGQIALNLFGVLGLLMGGFIIFNTFRTVIAERRRDIGMLRAVGASRRMIMGLILIEGVIQGVIGTAAGLALGYLFGLVVLNVIAPIGRQFLNIQVGSPAVTPGLLFFAVLMGVGVTLAAVMLPARSASRVTPLEALRPPVAQATSRRMAGAGFWTGIVFILVAAIALFSGQTGLIALGSVLFIIGLILAAPALVYPIARLFGSLLAGIYARSGTAQLAEGNLSRQPTRAAITASTTMIAMALVVMAATILSSISIGFIGMLERSLSSDFLLFPPSVSVWGTNIGATSNLAQELRSVEGVDVVTTMRFAGTQAEGVAASLLGVVPEDYVRTGGLTFIEGDAGTAFQEMKSDRRIIVNGVLATMAGKEVGDEITLLTPTGSEIYRIIALATDYLNAKVPTGYISQENISHDFGIGEDVFYQVNLTAGADFAQVEGTFKEILKAYPQFRLVAGEEYIEQSLVQFNAIFVGFYALVVFLAIPSLIAMVNTLAIGVIERTREIGMLRAVGATRRQIRMVILNEALILSAIGTAFGLLSGLYLGYMAVNAFSVLGFPMRYAFPANGVIAAIAAGLLFGAIAAILPARQAARMDVVAALRFE